MQMTLRQMEISCGLFQVHMAHQELNRSQVSSGLHQGCREAVPECVRANPLFDASAFCRLAADVPDGVIRNRLLYAAMSCSAGKQIDLWPPPSPVFT